MLRSFLLACGFCLASGASAQTAVESYYFSLGPQDFFNSSGTPLSGFATLMQQDRANYHRFNRRDPADEGDRIFGDRATRAMIPQLFANYPRNSFFERPGRGPGRTDFADFVVTVCAINGRLSHLVVNFADGDSRLPC